MPSTAPDRPTPVAVPAPDRAVADGAFGRDRCHNGPMATTFTRMDESTAEEWAVIGAETAKNQGRVAEQFLQMLRQCGDITDGFATDQLTHCLQTATKAEQAGA